MAFDDSLIGNDDFDPQAATASLVRQASDLPADGPIDVRALNTRLARKLGQPTPAETVAPAPVAAAPDFSAQAAPPPPAPTTDTSLDFSAQAAYPPASDQPQQPPLGIGGQLKAAGKGVAHGAIDSAGGIVQAGAIPNNKPESPEALALVDELAKAPGMNAHERAQLMGQALRTFKDRGNQMDYNTALQTIARGEDPAAVIQGLRDKLTAFNAQPTTPVMERPLWKRGQAVKDYAEQNVPMTAQEKDSIGGRAGEVIGGVAPYAVAGAVSPALGLGIGVAGMAATSAAGTFEEAKKKGATDGVAATAAGFSALVGGGLGALPLGAILRPVSQTAPGIAAWAAAKLNQAVVSGATFATIGEAQEYLTQQIAKNFYNKEAGYSWETKRVLASLLAGGALGAVHPLHKEAGADAATSTTPGATPGTGSSGAGPSPGRGPAPEDISSPEDIADFVKRAKAGAPPPPPGPESAKAGPDPSTMTDAERMAAFTKAREAFGGGSMDEILRAYGWDKSSIDQMDEQSKINEVIKAGHEKAAGTGKFSSDAEGNAQAKPEAKPEQSSSTEQTERDGLKRYGWTEPEIDAMSPAQRRQEFQDSMATGETGKPAATSESDVGGAAPSGPTIIDRASLMKAHAGPDGAVNIDKLSKAVTGQVRAALDAGKTVTLHTEGKQVPITDVINGMIADAKQQRWGMFQLLSPGQHHNRIEISDTPSAAAGTRDEPIKPKTAEDVMDAQPVEPTPAQAQAENYQHAHIELDHLGLSGKHSISVETGVGQERSGTAPDGTSWKVRLDHAAYGRIKGTKGADGQPLDIFVGPHPTSPHVFVIDQHHPEGGFDEHKIMAGYRTPIDALHAYAHSYDDAGKDRVGNVVAMGPDEFKAWMKGDTTKPLKTDAARGNINNDLLATLAKEPASSEPVKAEEAGSGSSTEAPVPSNGVPKETPTASGADAGGSAPKTPKQPNRSDESLSLLQFIANKGGLEPHPELDALDVGDHRAQIPGRKGFFGVVRPTGLKLDDMREAAEEAGYLRGEHNKTSTIRNLLDAIDNELRGHRHAAEGEEHHETKRQRTSKAESSAAARDQAIAAAHEDIGAEYRDLPDDLHTKAAEIMADERLDVDSAVEQAALRMVNEDADYGVTPHDITETFGEGALDAIRPKAASEDGGADSRAPDQEQRPDQGQEAGEHEERVPATVAEGSEGEEVKAWRSMEAALDAIEEAVDSGDRAAVLAAGKAAKKLLADIPQSIKNADPEHWSEAQYDQVIRGMMAPSYVTARTKALADAGKWWKNELTAAGREEAAKNAGLAPSVGKTSWQHIKPEDQEKLANVQSAPPGHKLHVAIDEEARKKAERDAPMWAEVLHVLPKDAKSQIDADAAFKYMKDQFGETAYKNLTPDQKHQMLDHFKPDQASIPGTEPIGDGELAQRKTDERLKPPVAQKAADIGLFSDEKDQGDLLDRMSHNVPAVPEKLFVNIEGRKFPLTNYADASRAYRDTVDRTGSTASGHTGPAAPPAIITDNKGNIVGHISYNGRVWAGTSQDWTGETKLLYDPRADDTDVKDLDGATAVLHADDADEEVTVTLSKKGPWDFNDTYPAPDVEKVRALAKEGRNPFVDGYDVGSIVQMLGEGVNDLAGEVGDMRRLDRDIAAFKDGTTKLKRKQTLDEAVKPLEIRRDLTMNGIRETRASYEDIFGEEAAHAMVSAARHIVGIEGQSSPERWMRPIDTIEHLLGSDADKVAQVDIARTAEIMFENPGMHAGTAFGQAVIENAVGQGFITEKEAEESYGQEAKNLLDAGREGASGRGEPVEQEGAPSEQVGAGDSAQAGELSRRSKAGEGASPGEVQGGELTNTGGTEPDAGRETSGGTDETEGVQGPVRTARSPEMDRQLEAELGDWWNLVLTDKGRREALDMADLNASPKTKWHYLTQDEQDRLATVRKEQFYGISPRIHERDAAGESEAVPPAARQRGTGPLRGVEGARGGEDVSGIDQGRPAGERLSDAADGPGSGGEGESGTVRVSGRHGDEQSRREEGPVQRDARAVKGENYHIEPGALGEDRSPRAKAVDNVQAIKLANRLIEEDRPATAAEQHQLARYVGWGGIKGAFAGPDGEYGKGFEQLGADLKEVLTPEEYDTARRSIQYAHYTSEEIINAMWGMAGRLGFTGGHVFEPGMGVGHFAGLMPPDLAEHTAYTGVEMDHVTARIAALLYPKWGVRRADFTRMPLAENAFDLVIGNPPFADVAIQSDPKYKQGFLLHDYFFAKSFDSVRPGGLMMFVTSAGTMNKIDPTARKYLAERGDLMAAIRLPSNAFRKNAGTDVTTDIIVLRKRVPGEAGDDRAWTQTVEVSLPGPDGKPIKGQINRYFAEHPEMVLGKQDFADKLYEGRYSVKPWDDFDLGDALTLVATKHLPRNVMTDPETPQHKAEVDFEGTEKKEGSYYLKDGRLMQQRDGAGREVERRGKGVENGKTAPELDRITALVPIRDALRETFAADLADDADAGKRARAKLNKAYDAFVEKFGPINKAEIQRRRPNAIQAEAARSEAREAARYIDEPFDEGSFSPSRMIAEGKSLTEIARARNAERERLGDKYREGTFEPEEMPDVIIDKRPNIDPFSDDQENYRLRAIENYDEPTNKGFKTAVFSRNIISKDKPPEIKSVNDAVLHVLNQKGMLDLDAIGTLVGKSKTEAIEALGDRIYQVPGTKGTWETREKYLSGNVRKKLTLAKAEAARNPIFRRNVDALEAAQPAPLAPSQIGASLGMPWIPPDVIEKFGKEALGLTVLKARYSPTVASWTLSGDTDSVAATSTWGTQRRNATALMLDALNRQNPKIYDEGPEKNQRTLNVVATQAAQEKMQAIHDKFEDWVFSDAKRADRLAAFYNENYNNLVVQEFNGDYLTTPGIAAHWKWRPHQKRVIARIIQNGNTYVAHAVGAGKTSEMIGAGMEMRRLGLVKKPGYTVPNHMLAQFAKEFYEQYPTARIMVADERQFHGDRRKQFMANVAMEDLDAVIMTHSSFGMIPVSDEFQDSIIEEELDEYRHALADTPKDHENRITRSRIEKQIERLEQRLSGKGNRKRDNVVNFDEMGIDFMFVDEAHKFRKLDFTTQMTNLKGITPQGSNMAWDLYIKSRLLEKRNPGRNLVLASGTPVTNTMAELYTISRYLQRAELAERQLSQFDAWAGAFGQNVTELEQDPAGGYKPVSRFAKFVNVPELSSMVRQVMDVVTSRQLSKYVVRPKLKGGQRIMNLAERSPALTAYQDRLAARMKAMQGRGKPKPGDDIMLKVIGDGRHAAIDMRLVGGEPDPDFPSKVDLAIANVVRIWKATKAQKLYGVKDGAYDMSKPADVGPATQMIFSNLGISGSRGFSVPDYIRAELVRRGIPRNEIAFISDYKSHVAKQRLFNDMNEGKVRVLVGSTEKMATGVNAQRRLYAVHNMDPLWFPSDDEQRNGRALRQGNMNPEIEINDYSTKGTYDSTMWHMMEKKARFIQGFFEGDPSMRDMDDLGEASQYEQAKALTTNDPRLMRLTDLRQQFERANRRKAAFDNEAYAMRRRRAQATSDIDYYSARQAGIEKDIAQRVPLSGDQFKATIGKSTFDKRVDFGEALLDTLDKIATAQNNGRTMPIGEISGFALVAKVQKIGDHMSVNVDMKRNGGAETHVTVGTSGLGAVRSMESIISGFDGDLEHVKEKVATERKYLADSEGKQNDKFTGDDEINKLSGEIKSLQAELAKKDEPPKVEESLAALSPGAEAKRPELANLVRAIVQHLVGDHVKVDLTDDLIPMNASAEAKWAGIAASGARGMYFPWRKLVKLALMKDVDSAAFHESYHAIEYQLQTPQERDLMERETPRLRDYVARSRPEYTRAQVDALAPEEIRAIAFEDFASDRSKGKPEAGREVHIGIRRWFDRLLQAIRKLVNGLHGLGFKTYEDIFEKAYRGDYANAPGDTPRPEADHSLASIFRRKQNTAVNQRIKDMMESTAANRFVERYQNLSEPVKRLQDAVEAKMNGTLPDTQAFYTKKRLFPGKVGAEVQNFNKEHLDPLIKYAADNKLSLEQVGDIAYALHAPERNAEMEKINHPALDGSDAAYVGRRSGMSDAEAAAILALHPPGVVAEIDHKLGAIRDYNMNMMVNSGLESQPTIDGWKAKYQHYAPLGGWEVAPDDAPDTTKGVGNFNVRGPEVRRAFGRRTKAANPMVNILTQAYRTIERAKRNEYVRSAALAIGSIDPAEQAGFVRFDKGKPKKEIDPRTGLVRTVDDSSYRLDPAAVGYKVGGNQRYMIFENRELGEAVKRMHPDGLGPLQPLLDIQNKIKALWTHYSPEFLLRHFLFRYPIEGTLNSFEQGANTVPQYVKDAIPLLGRASRAIFAHNKGVISSNPDIAQMQQYHREMREHGGAMAFRSMRDQDLLTEHLKSKLNSLNKTTWATVQAKHQAAVEAMDVVTNALDNSLRLAAYAAGRRQGKSPEQSALLARDATVDFQLAGKWKNALGLIWPFANVAIQTGARMTSAVVRSKTMQRVFMGTMLAGFLTGAFNYLVGGDDTDGVPFMDKIPEWERRLNFTVLNPWHRDAKGRPVPIHIPMPYNWAFPLTIGHAMATMVFGKNRHKLREMLGMIGKSGLEVMTPFGQEENLAAVLAPEMLRPAIHMYTNKNYNGIPVHADPAYQKGPAAESGRKTTGDGWKYIASAMNDATGGDKHHSGQLDFYPEDYRLMFDYFLGGQRRFIENSINAGKNAASGAATDYSHLPLSRVFMGTDYDASDTARKFDRLRENKRPWEK